MQKIDRYNLKPEKAEAYRTWLLENDQDFKDHAPDGWSYLGTWFTVQGFGAYSVESRWEIDDYAALGNAFGDDTFQRLMQEWSEFGDDVHAGETYLMKGADEVSIMEGD
jgi:hypothetical protein